jgi:hypothetical protein
MIRLYDDLIIKIMNELSDKHKIYMLMSSKQFNHLKFKIIYTELISISKIKSLSYFDNFESVSLDMYTMRCPKYVKFIHFLVNSIDIPDEVTHLTFNHIFNKPIENCIPHSVTHLTFGWKFDQEIDNCIPSSVTHLTFGWNFNQSIDNCIPSSVTHLTFGRHFDQPINNCIPSSVTHLTFGRYFNQPINNCIPSSVTHLTFGKNFNQSIKKLPKLVSLIMHKDYKWKQTKTHKNKTDIDK